ncbi:tetratricopeptide repeat protein [Actinokineospora pegani]|uniref:tetratricopeptide repeat protein n=1 Tax=Actinokineospora pegani TaxID=2654637 RepID=UPI0012E9CE68|nr:tetratricopeptide repeat protein [Actinokineospora pegani]
MTTPTPTFDLDALDTQALLDRAHLHQDAGDHRTAVRFLAQAATHEPRDTAILTELALAQFHTAALTAAEATARQLITLAPTDAYGHLLLGRTLARQSRHREALPHLRLAVAMSGQWADHLTESETRA